MHFTSMAFLKKCIICDFWHIKIMYQNIMNCLMLFAVQLHTDSSLWLTMWYKIHSHMLCSPLTSRAITAQSTAMLLRYSFCRTDHEDIVKAVLLQDTLTQQTGFLFKAKKKPFHTQTQTQKQRARYSVVDVVEGNDALKQTKMGLADLSTLVLLVHY